MYSNALSRLGRCPYLAALTVKEPQYSKPQQGRDPLFRCGNSLVPTAASVGTSGKTVEGGTIVAVASPTGGITRCYSSMYVTPAYNAR